MRCGLRRFTAAWHPVIAPRLHQRGFAAKKTPYVCSECGFTSNAMLGELRISVLVYTPKFSYMAGKCPSCGAWESMKRATFATAPRARNEHGAPPLQATAMGDIDLTAADHARLSTGIAELDGVLGGGAVTAARPTPGRDTSGSTLFSASPLGRARCHPHSRSSEASPAPANRRCCCKLPWGWRRRLPRALASTYQGKNRQPRWSQIKKN